jgi:hypothetical protein
MTRLLSGKRPNKKPAETTLQAQFSRPDLATKRRAAEGTF